MSKKKPVSDKRSTSVNINNFRKKIVGENFEQLVFISQYHNRKPSQMISHLIELEYKKIKKKI